MPEPTPIFTRTRATGLRKAVGIITHSKGATAVEYGIIAALIAAATMSSIEAIGIHNASILNCASNALIGQVDADCASSGAQVASNSSGNSGSGGASAGSSGSSAGNGGGSGGSTGGGTGDGSGAASSGGGSSAGGGTGAGNGGDKKNEAEKNQEKEGQKAEEK